MSVHVRACEIKKKWGGPAARSVVVATSPWSGSSGWLRRRVSASRFRSSGAEETRKNRPRTPEYGNARPRTKSLTRKDSLCAWMYVFVFCSQSPSLRRGFDSLHQLQRFQGLGRRAGAFLGQNGTRPVAVCPTRVPSPWWGPAPVAPLPPGFLHLHGVPTRFGRDHGGLSGHGVERRGADAWNTAGRTVWDSACPKWVEGVGRVGGLSPGAMGSHVHGAILGHHEDGRRPCPCGIASPLSAN